MAEPYCNPDLKRERANCAFNKEEVTIIFDGTKERMEERKKLGIMETQ